MYKGCHGYWSQPYKININHKTTSTVPKMRDSMFFQAFVEQSFDVCRSIFTCFPDGSKTDWRAVSFTSRSLFIVIRTLWFQVLMVLSQSHKTLFPFFFSALAQRNFEWTLFFSLVLLFYVCPLSTFFLDRRKLPKKKERRESSINRPCPKHG